LVTGGIAMSEACKRGAGWPPRLVWHRLRWINDCNGFQRNMVTAAETVDTSNIMRPASPAIVLAALLATMQPLLAERTRGDASSGRLYAQAWCTECHSVERETAGTGQFAPDFTAIARRRSTTARSLQAFLRSQHRLMPDFVLTGSETDDIVAYILSLKRR
jgi:mono/diheme cytochrome c family protein